MESRAQSEASSTPSPKRVRLALDRNEVREFNVVGRRNRAEPDDSSNREYEIALTVRARKARDETVPNNTSASHAFWRAKRLQMTLQNDDESHLGYSARQLARYRAFIAATEDTGRTHDKHPNPGVVDLISQCEDILSEDVAHGATAACSGSVAEPESTACSGASATDAPNSARSKGKKLVHVWHSFSSKCRRAAEFTSKGLYNMRKKTWFEGVNSKDAPNGDSKHARFFHWPTRSHSHSSFASVVPHDS